MKSLVAYPQAITEMTSWAGESAGDQEEYFEGSAIGLFRQFGATALAAISHKYPSINARSLLEPMLVDTKGLISIGAEAVVKLHQDSEKGEVYVKKVLTGKPKNPKILEPMLVERRTGLRRAVGESAVETEYDIQKLKLFKWLPAQEYVCAKQPYINIDHASILEDDELLDTDIELSRRLLRIVIKLQVLARERGFLYDLAKSGNIVMDTDGSLLLPDVTTASIEQKYRKDFVGLRTFGLWDAGIYERAYDMHFQRLSSKLARPEAA